MDLSAEAQLTANRNDCTSENSPIVRAEVKDLFEGQYGEQEGCSDEDRRKYETKVRQAMRNQRGVDTEAEGNEDGKEKTRREKKRL